MLKKISDLTGGILGCPSSQNNQKTAQATRRSIIQQSSRHLLGYSATANISPLKSLVHGHVISQTMMAQSPRGADQVAPPNQTMTQKVMVKLKQSLPGDLSHKSQERLKSCPTSQLIQMEHHMSNQKSQLLYKTTMGQSRNEEQLVSLGINQSSRGKNSTSFRPRTAHVSGCIVKSTRSKPILNSIKESQRILQGTNSAETQPSSVVTNCRIMSANVSGFQNYQMKSFSRFENASSQKLRNFGVKKILAKEEKA